MTANTRAATNNIRKLRKNHGLSVHELSDLLNVHWNTIYNWETGRTEPKSSQICALAELFGCDAETVMALTD